MAGAEGPGSPADGRAWLERFTADEWLRAAQGELRRARAALEGHNAPAAAAGLKRAAGMALNGALRVVDRPEWGRTYVEHLRALVSDERAPTAVQEAAEVLLRPGPPPGLAALTTQRDDAARIDAAETVMAHAYAVVHGSAGRP